MNPQTTPELLESSLPDPIEFVRRGKEGGEAELFACCNCGQVYSPRIYATTTEIGLVHAREAARNCTACKSRELDPDEQRIAFAENRARLITKATEVTDLDCCFSDDGDGFYTSIEEAADAGETGVFGARFKPFCVNFDDLIDLLIDDHHDEASSNDLVGLDQLNQAIDEFNNKQTGGSYFMDTGRWQKIPQTQTFGMIKPDATARGIENEMIADIEAAGFRIVEQRRCVMPREDAEWLYQEHRRKEHFKDLVDYTISGDVIMLLIEGDRDDVPAEFRTLMGPTDRTKAPPHTLRSKYAIGLRENSVHGSDSPRAAIDEIIHFMR